MKYTKIIIAAALALTLTACADTNTNTAEETTLLSETTSEAVVTEDITTSAETVLSTEESTTTTVESTTVSEEIVGVDDSEYNVETEDETSAVTEKKTAADGEYAAFSRSKIDVRLYADNMFSDGEDIVHEPSAEDKKLFEKASDCLTIYERYNNFIDHKNYNEAAYAGEGGVPLIMDDYLDENENAAAKLKWALTSDLNGDGHEESLLVINTAVMFTEMGAKNEFLVYINDNGEAVPVMQECCIRIDDVDVLDYGDFKYIPITVGNNNASSGTYIFNFDGKEFTEKLHAEWASPAYDEATGRIYFTIQGYFDSCYILNSKTLEYDKYDAPQEEFDKFIENYEY